MRLRAAQKLGYKEVPVIILPGLTEAQEKEITIKDNGAWGQWDFDALANAWSDLPLKDWGVDIPADWAAGKINDLSDKTEVEFKIQVNCEDEAEQEAVYKKLIKMGLECQILTL
jgi:hypothetical protein